MSPAPRPDPVRPQRRAVITQTLPEHPVLLTAATLTLLAHRVTEPPMAASPPSAPPPYTGPGPYESIDFIAAFRERGLYLKELAGGRHAVTCLWKSAHTLESSTRRFVLPVQSRASVGLQMYASALCDPQHSSRHSVPGSTSACQWPAQCASDGPRPRLRLYRDHRGLSRGRGPASHRRVPRGTAVRRAAAAPRRPASPEEPRRLRVRALGRHRYRALRPATVPAAEKIPVLYVQEKTPGPSPAPACAGWSRIAVGMPDPKPCTSSSAVASTSMTPSGWPSSSPTSAGSMQARPGRRPPLLRQDR